MKKLLLALMLTTSCAAYSQSMTVEYMSHYTVRGVMTLMMCVSLYGDTHDNLKITYDLYTASVRFNDFVRENEELKSIVTYPDMTESTLAEIVRVVIKDHDKFLTYIDIRNAIITAGSRTLKDVPFCI